MKTILESAVRNNGRQVRNKTVSKAFDIHFWYSVQKHSSKIFVRELLRELCSCKVLEKAQKAP